MNDIEKIFSESQISRKGFNFRTDRDGNKFLALEYSNIKNIIWVNDNSIFPLFKGRMSLSASATSLKKQKNMIKSIISLCAIDSISAFRKKNQTKIKSEKIENHACVYFNLKNGTTEIVRNYYEYKIDDKYLSEHLSEHFWHNSKSVIYNPDFKFNDYWVGYVGSFNKFWDIIKIRSLLRLACSKEELLNEEFVQNYLIKVDEEHHNSIIQSILNEFDYSEVEVYGCRICGDKECGTLNVKIELDNNVTWTFTDEERTLKWMFDKKQYNSEFQKLLKSVSEK